MKTGGEDLLCYHLSQTSRKLYRMADETNGSALPDASGKKPKKRKLKQTAEALINRTAIGKKLYSNRRTRTILSAAAAFA